MKSLRQGVQEYLEYRWRLGFKLHRTQHLLTHFVSFMEQNRAKHITFKLALKFATMDTKAPNAWASRLGIIRRFAEYWSTVDPKTEVPQKKLLPNSYKRQSPYIYTDTEVTKLVECSESGYPNDRFDQYTYFVLFGLLAVTGMRIGEALALNCEAVNVQNKIITIYQSKFRKSRYIPIHKTTAEVLNDYSKYRNQCFPNPTTSRFFIDRTGKALAERRVRHVFHKRLTKIGLTESKGCNPRIISLRHTFAVKTLLRWYKQGLAPVDQCIPLLATYLGHVKPTNTYWYLTATPQLLQLVVSRCKTYNKRAES